MVEVEVVTRTTGSDIKVWSVLCPTQEVVDPGVSLVLCVFFEIACVGTVFSVVASAIGRRFFYVGEGFRNL